MDSPRRRPWIEWIHTALVQGNHVRDFVKFDDQPATAGGVVESILRAYRLMSAEPTGPVYVCLDAALQEDPLPKGISMPTDLQRWVSQTPVQADSDGLRTAGQWLSESRRPVILADTVGRSLTGVRALQALAEKLNAPVVDLGSRFNFPSDHPLEATERREQLIREADVIFGVDVVDLWGALQANAARHLPAGYAPSASAKLVSLSVSDLLVHSWTSDYQRMQPVDLSLVGDSRVALPALVDLVQTGAGGGGAAQDRAARAETLAAEGRTRRAEWEDRARAQATSSPVALGYLGLALRDALQGQDWVLSNSDLRGWARRLWRLEHPYQYTGTAGGAGLGYGIGASLGVGLAHKGSGRIVVNLQPDGDLLYCSSALYTAAHERLPLLMIMLNNHSYYNSEEHGLRMAEHRGRPAERAGIGTRPEGPAVDFATLARSFSIASAGPITSAAELPRALATAMEVVSSGQPYLLDVVTEVR
jgi:thiamine pyrophosphate-dependent acetolactate synthase large subunit-like protein